MSNLKTANPVKFLKPVVLKTVIYTTTEKWDFKWCGVAKGNRKNIYIYVKVV